MKKRILAVNNCYMWRLIETKNWYKLQRSGAFCWRTVAKTDSEGFIDGTCDIWVDELNLRWIQQRI